MLHNLILTETKAKLVKTHNPVQLSSCNGHNVHKYIPVGSTVEQCDCVKWPDGSVLLFTHHNLATTKFSDQSTLNFGPF